MQTHTVVEQGDLRGSPFVQVPITNPDPTEAVEAVVRARGPNTLLVEFTESASWNHDFIDSVAIQLSRDPRTEDLLVWVQQPHTASDWPSDPAGNIWISIDGTELLEDNPELDRLNRRLTQEIPYLPHMSELIIRVESTTARHLDAIAAELQPPVGYVVCSDQARQQMIQTLARCHTPWRLA